MDISIRKKKILLSFVFLVLTLVSYVPSVKAFGSQDINDIGRSLMFGSLHWFGEVGLIVALFILNMLNKYSIVITEVISILAFIEYLRHGIVWGSLVMFFCMMVFLLARPRD